MSSFKSGSVEVWDEIWQGADKSYSDNPTTQNQVFEHIKIGSLSKIFPKGNFKMVEVGSGTAFVSLYFAKHGASTTSLDTNDRVLAVAKENFKREGAKGNFVKSNAEHLPFKDNQFDVVTSFGLLEHFKDPSVPIKEMVRVLAPGGIFFADIVPNRFSCQTLGNWFNLFASIVFWSLKGKPKTGWQKGIRNFRPLYFENSYSLEVYRKIIEDAGVRNIEIRGNRPFPRLTLPLMLDKIYASIIKIFIPLWKRFDAGGSGFSLFWGAGWWFWGKK